MRLIPFTALLISTLAIPVHAADKKCYGPSDQATLEGIVTQKAVYITKDDFGWAPDNGFVAYDVIVLKEPICYQDDEEYVGDAIIIQTSAEALGKDAKREGVNVKIVGKVYSAHTGHHYQKLLIAPESLTILNK